MGQQPNDPDLIAIPDLQSFTPLHFVRPGLAMVHCDPHVEGRPHPFAPRVILRRVLAQAAERDLELMSGAEIEYFLLRRRADGSLATADQQDTAEQPCYDSRGVTRMYDHLTAISDAMNTLGWGPYASDHEDGNGQFEQNFTYADALTTADRVITLRYVLHAGGPARHDRQLHAQAVHRPHRLRNAPASLVVAERVRAVPVIRPGRARAGP